MFRSAASQVHVAAKLLIVSSLKFYCGLARVKDAVRSGLEHGMEPGSGSQAVFARFHKSSGFRPLESYS